MRTYIARATGKKQIVLPRSGVDPVSLLFLIHALSVTAYTEDDEPKRRVSPKIYHTGPCLEVRGGGGFSKRAVWLWSSSSSSPPSSWCATKTLPPAMTNGSGPGKGDHATSILSTFGRESRQGRGGRGGGITDRSVDAKEEEKSVLTRWSLPPRAQLKYLSARDFFFQNKKETRVASVSRIFLFYPFLFLFFLFSAC